MFLDDTACNLASLNLMTFYDEQTGEIRIEDLRHAIRLWTIVLEISVLMAQFPAQGDRAQELRLPHPRPGVRQPGHPAHGHGDPLRQRGGPRNRGGPVRHPFGGGLCHLRGDGGRARAVPAVHGEPGGSCSASSATTAGPPTARPPRSTRASRSSRSPSTPSSARPT